MEQVYILSKEEYDKIKNRLSWIISNVDSIKSCSEEFINGERISDNYKDCMVLFAHNIEENVDTIKNAMRIIV